MTTSDQTMIAALLRERESYERQSKTDRVKQVDDQLHRLGYTGEEDQDDTGPTGRTAQDPTQQSADAPTGQTAASDTAELTAQATTGEPAPPPATETAPALKPPAKKTAGRRAKD